MEKESNPPAAGAPQSSVDGDATADSRSESISPLLEELARLPSRRILRGTRLGPYEIVAPLGAGGMGAVYRAHDTRLGRDVAVKVLPDAFREDPDRLRRFEREARAAAALLHPNLLAVFDVGTEDGTPYLVSEILEGETLRERLASGPLPVRRAIEFAVEIARGLAAAHGQGIVHRDLKPENLFVTREGHVKILDFGLAKLTEAPEATGERTASGAILGTPGYMSPEQVRGLPVDHRSDIFNLGAVLYEMLCGRRAFGTGSSVEAMHAILKEEPADLSQFKPNVPLALERLVRRCLEKDPEHRFQSARDLGFALEAVSYTSGASEPLAIGAIPRRGARALFAAALAVVLGTGAFVAGWLVSGESATRPAPATAPPPLFQRMTFGPGMVSAGRFTSDGQSFVYSGFDRGRHQGIYYGRLGRPEVRMLGFPDSRLAAVSSRGEMALIRGRVVGVAASFRPGTLARVPVTGSAPRDVLADVVFADWSPDGSHLAVVRAVRDRHRLEYPPGRVLYEAVALSHPRVSPRGDWVAFFEHPVPMDDQGTLAVVDLSARKRTLTKKWASATGLAWSPDGEEILYSATDSGSARAVHAVALSGEDRILLRGPDNLHLQDVSRDGRLLVARDLTHSIVLAKGARDSEESEISLHGRTTVLDVSPDGLRFMLQDCGDVTASDCRVYLRAPNEPAVLLGDGTAGRLSPDGRSVLMQSSDASSNRIAIVPIGAGDPRVVPGEGFAARAWPNWLPDGESLVFSGLEPGGTARIYVQRVSEARARPISPPHVALDFGNPVSPDGRWVAGIRTDGTVALYPVGGGEPRPALGLKPHERPIQWTPDGRALYVYRLFAVPKEIFRVDVKTGERTLWKTFGAGERRGIRGIGCLVVNPAGTAYAYCLFRGWSDLFIVDGVVRRGER